MSGLGEPGVALLSPAKGRACRRVSIGRRMSIECQCHSHMGIGTAHESLSREFVGNEKRPVSVTIEVVHMVEVPNLALWIASYGSVLEHKMRCQHAASHSGMWSDIGNVDDGRLCTKKRCTSSGSRVLSEGAQTTSLTRGCGPRYKTLP